MLIREVYENSEIVKKYFDTMRILVAAKVWQNVFESFQRYYLRFKKKVKKYFDNMRILAY